MAAMTTHQKQQHQHHPSTLLSSSIFSTPSFSSTLPIVGGRPNLASGAYPRRPSAQRRSRLGSRNVSFQQQHQRRRTRSVTSDMDDESDDGSLGDLSIENYTIDLAELAKQESGKIGVIGLEADEGYVRSGADFEDELKEEYDVDRDDVLAGYEVDLGALGEKPSGVVVEDHQEELDEVASKVDGPEDFTLNMGAWMRGTKNIIKERDMPSDLDEQRLTRLEKEANDASLGLGDGDSIVEPLGTSTPAPKLVSKEQTHVTAGHAKQRPFLARGETELLQDQSAEEVFRKISALRAEVEQMRDAEERRRAAYKQLQEENREMKDRYGDSPITSKELVAVKAESERERMASKEKIETLEVGLKASHATVRQLRQEMTEDEQLQNNKIAGLKEDIDRLRTEIDRKSAQIADMMQDAETQNEIVAHRDQLIARLTTDVEITRKELEYAKQEARESRRISESVQEENDGLISQQTRQNEELAAAEAALQSNDTGLPAAHSTIASLREQQPDAIMSESSHQAILDGLKQEHAGALSALNQKFARQLQLFKQDRDAQAARHANELAKAKETPSASTAMETELRSAIRALSSKLEKAHAATKTARVEVETVQAELDQARHATETMRRDNQSVNQDLERRFAEAIEAREREWRRRVAVLFKERERMGKALMAGWGREEVGLAVKGGDGGQGYRYRYVKR